MIEASPHSWAMRPILEATISTVVLAAAAAPLVMLVQSPSCMQSALLRPARRLLPGGIDDGRRQVFGMHQDGEVGNKLRADARAPWNESASRRSTLLGYIPSSPAASSSQTVRGSTEWWSFLQ